jgi:hypothetical protein
MTRDSYSLVWDMQNDVSQDSLMVAVMSQERDPETWWFRIFPQQDYFNAVELNRL